jgi:RNA polymerase sigma-70 factor (ECF subfamily)
MMKAEVPADQVGEAGEVMDDAVVVRAAQRDPAAFAPLYSRYHPRVYRYLRLRTASDDEAADLTQQCFVQALAALPGYRERGLPFPAWLFRIARNVAIDTHRKRRVTVDWDLLPEALHGTDEGPETTVLRHERVARLRDLLGDLDAEKREMLGLRFAAGLSSREIASVVGKSEAAVKKQITRTIQHLREHYGDA